MAAVGYNFGPLLLIGWQRSWVTSSRATIFRSGTIPEPATGIVRFQSAFFTGNGGLYFIDSPLALTLANFQRGQRVRGMRNIGSLSTIS
jgi:hypothetical protein